MRKLILALFIILPTLVIGQKKLSFTIDEMYQFSIGIKKSDAEKLLQKIALKQGISFSMENYRKLDLDEIKKPEELVLDEKRTKAYECGEGQNLVFYNDSLSLIYITTKSYKQNEAEADLQKLMVKLGQSSENVNKYPNLNFFIVNDAAFILTIQQSYRSYRLNYITIRKDWISEQELEKLAEIQRNGGADIPINEEKEEVTAYEGDYDEIVADSTFVVNEIDPTADFDDEKISFTAEEIDLFNIGMKKSSAEEEIQKIALKKGISFNLEDYRTFDMDDITKPSRLVLDEKRVNAYKYDENNILVFYNDSLSLMFLGSIAYPKSEADAEQEKLKAKLSETLGDSQNFKEMNLWLSENAFLVLGTKPADYNKYTVNKVSIRKDWLTEEELDQINRDINEVDDPELETYEVEEVEPVEIEVGRE